MSKSVSFQVAPPRIGNIEAQLSNTSGLSWSCQGARGGIKALNRFPLTVARARSFTFSGSAKVSAQF